MVDPRQVLASLRRAGPAFFVRFGGLTPVQIAAIPDLLAGRDALVSAPTAGGKTEAVAAPLAERYLAASPEGLWLLYICPTRALVNDLHRRLATPLERLDIPLARKSSDHPLRSSGRLSGWLLTTPESLDSLLVRRPRDLLALGAIVLDEVHLVDGSVRGDQLRILVSRIRRLHRAARERGDRPARATLQTVLVTATAADPAGLTTAFAPDAVRIQAAGRRHIETIGVGLASTGTLRRALGRIPRSEAHKLLIFTRSRRDCEEVVSELAGKPPYGPDVYAHHGSLSRRTRLVAETAFHRAAQAVFVATSTLELGIDIGDVDWVVQFGPPSSVTSFLQQIGRGCRRRQDVTRVLGLARDAAEEVIFEVILGLARRGAIERPGRVFAASVLVQQIASYLLQRSGGTIGRADIESVLAGPDPSRPVPDQAGPGPLGHLDEVLGSLTAHGLLVIGRGGRYGIGSTLERWIENQPRRLHTNLGPPAGTLAVFDSETHELLGEVPASGIPAAGRVAFGGRSGHLVVRDDRRAYLETRRGEPAAAPGYRSPRLPMSTELAQAIREHLGLPAGTVAAIGAGEDTIALFPFLGGVGTRVLAAHLRARGVRIRQATDLALTMDAPPRPDQLRLEEHTLDRAVATCWKSLERLQGAGAHVHLLPDDLRRRQVVHRVLASGVIPITSGFEEVRPVTGETADLLARFL